MTDFFTPYEGKSPYLFISYAHLDSRRVLQFARGLHELRYRVWYDEGIAPGSNWPANIARHLNSAACVLFFISEASIASPNCAREIGFALQKKIPVRCVRLDDTELYGAPWEALQSEPALLLAAHEADMVSALALDQSLLGDGMTGYTHTAQAGAGFNGWLVAMILGALLFVAAVMNVIGLASGRFDALLGLNGPGATAAPVKTAVPRTPAPTATPVATIAVDDALMQNILDAAAGKNIAFTCAQEERILRRALGVEKDERVRDDDLLSLTALHICGTTQLKSREGIEIGADIRVNGAPVLRGEIASLSTFAQMYAMTELTLCDQSITDIRALASLQRLQYLNVSCNPIKTLPDLSEMLSLTELDISHTGIRDVRALNDLQNLQKVYADAAMFPLQTEPSAQRFDIVLVK